MSLENGLSHTDLPHALKEEEKVYIFRPPGQRKGYIRKLFLSLFFSFTFFFAENNCLSLSLFLFSYSQKTPLPSPPAAKSPKISPLPPSLPALTTDRPHRKRETTFAFFLLLLFFFLPFFVAARKKCPFLFSLQHETATDASHKNFFYIRRVLRD